MQRLAEERRPNWTEMPSGDPRLLCRPLDLVVSAGFHALSQFAEQQCQKTFGRVEKVNVQELVAHELFLMFWTDVRRQGLFLSTAAVRNCGRRPCRDYTFFSTVVSGGNSRSPPMQRGQLVRLTSSTVSGERGIRTPGPVTRTQHFQCCTIGHSATSPDDRVSMLC